MVNCQIAWQVYDEIEYEDEENYVDEDDNDFDDPMIITKNLDDRVSKNIYIYLFIKIFRFFFFKLIYTLIEYFYFSLKSEFQMLLLLNQKL